MRNAFVKDGMIRDLELGTVYPSASAGPAVTHRPSRLDAEHTACGEKMGPNTHLQFGNGETCERCTHAVAQIAAALRGEPSWALC